MRLPLVLEARNDLLRVHPSLMILRVTRRRTGSILFGHPDDAEPALADLLEPLVIADPLRSLPHKYFKTRGVIGRRKTPWTGETTNH